MCTHWLNKQELNSVFFDFFEGGRHKRISIDVVKIKKTLHILHNLTCGLEPHGLSLCKMTLHTSYTSYTKLCDLCKFVQGCVRPPYTALRLEPRGFKGGCVRCVRFFGVYVPHRFSGKKKRVTLARKVQVTRFTHQQ